MLLKGKNIVITGSGRGIGRSVAIACAKEGANIGLVARTTDELNETKKQIEKLNNGIKVIIKVADITTFEDVAKAFKEIHDEVGLINGVIANAGASRMGNTHEFDNASFSDILNVNVLGVFHTFKAAYPYMKKDDKNDKARFIITGSAAFPNAMPKLAAYTATKYATVGFQKAIAAEYKTENINFNQILPTMVDTRLLRGSKAGDGNKPEIVLNPWDLNDYYLFLLSGAANRVNDQLITSSDFQDVKRLLNDAPPEKRENWEVFKNYIEEKAPKTFSNIKKLGKLVDFIIERSN